MSLLQISSEGKNGTRTYSSCQVRPTKEQALTPNTKRGQKWNKNIFHLSSKANNGTSAYSKCQVRPTMEQEYIPVVKWDQQRNNRLLQISSEVNNGTRTYSSCQVRPTKEQALAPDIKWSQLRKKNMFQIASESTMEEELQRSNDANNWKITYSWCHIRPTIEQEHIPHAKWGQQWNKNTFHASREVNNGTITHSMRQGSSTIE